MSLDKYPKPFKLPNFDLENIYNISGFTRDTGPVLLYSRVTPTYASAINPMQVWT